MIKDITTAEKIKQKIDSAKKILLITHQNPDGDGLGGLIALAEYISILGKDYTLFCVTEVPEKYNFSLCP